MKITSALRSSIKLALNNLRGGDECRYAVQHWLQMATEECSLWIRSYEEGIDPEDFKLEKSEPTGTAADSVSRTSPALDAGRASTPEVCSHGVSDKPEDARDETIPSSKVSGFPVEMELSGIGGLPPGTPSKQGVTAGETANFGKPEEQPEPNLSTQNTRPLSTLIWGVFVKGKKCPMQCFEEEDQATAYTKMNRFYRPDNLEVVPLSEVIRFTPDILATLEASDPKGADSVSDGGSSSASGVSGNTCWRCSGSGELCISNDVSIKCWVCHGAGTLSVESLSAGVKEQEWRIVPDSEEINYATLIHGSKDICSMPKWQAKAIAKYANSSVAALRERITQLEKALEEKKRRM